MRIRILVEEENEAGEYEVLYGSEISFREEVLEQSKEPFSSFVINRIKEQVEVVIDELKLDAFEVNS